jgi:anti-sigma B factor antagonist
LDDETERELGLEVEQRGTAATVRVSGELDGSTCPELLWACRSLYERGAREVVIDLTDTTFLDSSALHVLVIARQLFDDEGALRLSNPSEPVMELLDLTGFVDEFSIDDAPPA